MMQGKMPSIGLGTYRLLGKECKNYVNRVLNSIIKKQDPARAADPVIKSLKIT